MIFAFGWAMERLWVFALVLLLACTGSSRSDPSNPDPSNPDPSQPATNACKDVTIATAPATLRRLTLEQQTNSYRDVLASPALAVDLAPLAGPIITEQEVEKLNLAAHAMVVTGAHTRYLTCSITGAANSGCADKFIADFGRVVFRRPLAADETQGFKTDVYEAVRTNSAITPAATFKECIDAVAEAILQAPQYLYIHEEGVSDANLPRGYSRLTGPERATRLSYLFWNSTPDEALLAAAEAGTLDTADGVRAQAERLLQSPKARSAARGVMTAWLQLDGNAHQSSLEATPKNATVFPFDSPALRRAMREEVLSLYERVLFDGDARFSSLMTTRKAYVNKTLGTLYGVTQNLPASDSVSAWVDLNEQQRAGLFTRAAFLALYTPQETASPIRRGVFLYRDVLGQALGAPPPNVNNTPLKPDPNALSVRAQVEARTSPAACQGCHGFINPLGYALGSYDAIGRYQTVDTGTLDGKPYSVPVDTSVSILAGDLKGPLGGPIELATKLATSPSAHDALARLFFQHANARAAVATDACSVQRLATRFRSSDDMKDLLLSLTTDDNALFLQDSP
jgi:Protein of unknown function (DUF1592)/Protein of unknown function (DUF1588)/Protein of unknown function (DUF1595)/Protein of unknown function (DUF1585)